MTREYSTNEARALIMSEMNVCIPPDLKTVKQYFTLVQGEDKKGSKKIWVRNSIFIIPENIIIPNNEEGSDYMHRY